MNKLAVLVPFITIQAMYDVARNTEVNRAWLDLDHQDALRENRLRDKAKGAK